MVKHQHNGRIYWTLPGGGVLEGESLEQAVIREVLEETNLGVKVVRFLFEEPYEYGISYCFLASLEGTAKPQLGNDPGQKEDSGFDLAMLQGVDWHPLESMRNDQQVSKVITVLGMSIHAGTSEQHRSNKTSFAKD